MNKKARIDYTLCTLCMFVSSYILYALISAWATDSAGFALSFWKGGLMGGYGFTAILHTIIVGARFFAKKRRRFKIISALLWPITVYVLITVGLIGFIPYFVYNLAMIFRAQQQLQ